MAVVLLSTNMELGILASGLLMGFSLAVGVGPVNVLCIRRALTSGHQAGLWSGFGAATADAIFALIVGFGLASITGLMQTYASILQIGGAIFLIAWGVRVALSRVEAKSEEQNPRQIVLNYATTFFLTLLNPANLATFGLAATGLGLLERDLGAAAIALLVIGVFIGSMVWWTLLSFGAATLKRRFVGDLLPLVNKVAGSLIVAFGVALLFYNPAAPETAEEKPAGPLSRAEELD